MAKKFSSAGLALPGASGRDQTSGSSQFRAI
jgi:hypothetical protein